MEPLINRINGSNSTDIGYQRKKLNDSNRLLPVVVRNHKSKQDNFTPPHLRWRTIAIPFAIFFLALAIVYFVFTAARLIAGAIGTEPSYVEPGKSWLYHKMDDIKSGLDGTCVSLRDRHYLYSNNDLVPSPAFIKRLREYEAMHQRCVGNVSRFSDHFWDPKASLKGCKYLIWKTDTGGLGNRFLSILAAFEYALLTDRALLVNTDGSIKKLLCNPFPESSIWTPQNFPLEELFTAPHQNEFIDGKTVHVGKKDFDRNDMVTSYLRHDYNDFKDENKFFCKAYQTKLQEARWMLWDSNQYIGPALYLVAPFETKLNEWFPDKVVTTHTARYLLHPSNRVWAKIVRIYKAYFAHVGFKVGVQVRTFAHFDPEVAMRLAACMTMEKVLPLPISEDRWNELSRDPVWLDAHKETSNETNLVSVFVTSLDAGYYDKLKEIFNERPTEDGRIVAVHMESHEKQEVHESVSDQRAMVEIWLLSMSDVLFISSKSTFGYVANALHGSKSFYLNSRDGEWQENGKPVCAPAWSTNACFHVKPLGIECPDETSHAFEDTNSWLPYVRQCQDAKIGIVVSPNL